MADLRLAIVTPRFWPLIDDRSLHLLRLGEALAFAGCELTVVTPRWTRAWPERMMLGPLQVRRLPGTAAGRLGTLRWMYELGRWLRREAAPVVLVAGMQREATMVLAAAHQRGFVPLLLAGEDDLAWQLATAAGTRASERCREAQMIVAPSEALAQELLAAGYVSGQLAVIPRGAAATANRSDEQRAAARLALAGVNYDLATTSNSLVALAVGRLDKAHRFGDLVRAWRIVTARCPEAKLWIVGDGPERQRLYQQIGDLDQRFRAMLPGMFERLDDLLVACDLLLVPAPHVVPPLVLLDAQAAGIPVVVAPADYAPGDIKALADCIHHRWETQSPSPAFASPSPWTVAAEAAAYRDLLHQLQCGR